MIDAVMSDTVRIILVLILITAALIISTRTLSALVRVYSIQSLLITVMACVLWYMTREDTLLLIAAITFAAKVILIPSFISGIQKKIHIRRDLEFSYLKPAGSIVVSLMLMLLVYVVFSGVFGSFATENPLFFLGSIVGVSLMLMGMLVTFSRKKTITKVMGYLSMENGVLVFGCFATELPFIVEVMILVDLIILVILTTILTIGIDSSLEEFQERLVRYHIWPAGEDEQ
ncbi:hydrogenase-4 component E [Methanolacinia petrolearia DSM 11571]|uniref:Hydrogenase-4 component E n=1 Tax=Methanolacinia petrolearia (strain DSM 11571 / OCM 486 / SEBR 4847) TaxID=679926 RepID=E1RKF6_METP4|nr:hydrogenase-4 component E [Methanolacinia petrolearia]ADN35809.1 hydrogenase-4 component E [Methanolacinia petrolearia DSM 11571]